ncbi:hypothetical protein AAFN47_12580 [Hoeflea sp. CAU 1731]
MSDSESPSNHALDPSPFWWVEPSATDWMAWIAIAVIALAIYLVIVLYAKFDHWAENKSKGTPLARTIPTMLAVALLYEIFPLDHFHILLPVSAILVALMADFMHAQSMRNAIKQNTDSVAEPHANDVETSPAAGGVTDA